MKRLVVGLLILSLLFTFEIARALESDKNILQKAQQIIASNKDCAALNDEELETLGEYFMEKAHPGDAHEAMDRMMGGEGSQSLRTAHINMGRAFYCGTGMVGSMMGMGMMSGGMMGPVSAINSMMQYRGGVSGSGGMMGYPFGADVWTGGNLMVFWILFWIVIVLGALGIIRILTKRETGSRALDFLKERYARGEITKEEFDSKKKDLIS